jgi:hypothetical protein
MEQMRSAAGNRPFRPFTSMLFEFSYNKPSSITVITQPLTDCTPVTCLDPRSNPEKVLGPHFLSPIFRNAGGRATEDAIRSINTLRYLIDITHVLVIHHTG